MAQHPEGPWPIDWYERRAFLPLDYEERYFREFHGMSTSDMEEKP